jgi:hypothetical protein
VTEIYDATTAELAKMSREVQESGLAKALLAAAKALDAPQKGFSALLLKEFRESWALLRELSPPAVERDAVDQLAARRIARRA